MVIVAFEVVCPVRENQAGELEHITNFGRSGPFGNFGQVKLWIMLLKHDIWFYLFFSVTEVDSEEYLNLKAVIIKSFSSLLLFPSRFKAG